MLRQFGRLVLVSCLLLVFADPIYAGFGGLFRKGATVAVKGSGKAGRVAAREATQAATKVAAKGIRTTGQKATNVGLKGSRRTVLPGARAVVDDLGMEGAQLLGRLSPRSAGQLAEISGELAKSPHRRQWLATLATHGDKATQWLWKRKGAIFCTTAATVVALHPEEFLQAMESATNVATREIAQHVAAPIAKEIAVQAASTFPWVQLWGGLKVVMVGLICFGLWRFRRWKSK